MRKGEEAKEIAVEIARRDQPKTIKTNPAASKARRVVGCFCIGGFVREACVELYFWCMLHCAALKYVLTYTESGKHQTYYYGL